MQVLKHRLAICHLIRKPEYFGIYSSQIKTQKQEKALTEFVKK